MTFELMATKIFIKAANHVSLPTISNSKIMTALFHFAPTIRLSQGRRNLILDGSQFSYVDVLMTDILLKTAFNLCRFQCYPEL